MKKAITITIEYPDSDVLNPHDTDLKELEHEAINILGIAEDVAEGRWKISATVQEVIDLQIDTNVGKIEEGEIPIDVDVLIMPKEPVKAEKRKIEPLKDHLIYGRGYKDENGKWCYDVEGAAPPTIRDIVDKINEIIDYINND